MKKIGLLAGLVFLFISATAQKNIEGAWEGKLNVGPTSLRIVFHIKKEGAGYTATMDSPDQGATGIAVSKTEVRADSLFLEVAAIGGKVEGRLLSDSVFSGQLSQGMSLPLEMKKVATPTKLNRPQTPQPPFSYFSEDVLYYNKDSSIQYGATITSPMKKAGPLPAIILITGSGQQNRDEELFGHKPFAVLADYLTKQGFIVLRVDDRGVGQTTGDVKSATSKNFADDVIAGIAFLKNNPGVAKNKIGLLGHSEGGMIAQLVAAERPEIAFVVSLAGPGQKVDELMIEQNRAILLVAGIQSAAVEDYIKLYRNILPAVLNAPSDSAAKTAALRLLTDWTNQVPKETVAATLGAYTEKDLTQAANSFVQTLRTPWFRYFLAYDPAPYIQKMKAKVLALNGGKDIQVVSKPNLDAWRTALAKSGVKKYDVVELKGLNHLFQKCTTCTAEEYGQIEQTIAPEALEIIGNWLKANVK